jgi:hypothetical protein
VTKSGKTPRLGHEHIRQFSGLERGMDRVLAPESGA